MSSWRIFKLAWRIKITENEIRLKHRMPYKFKKRKILSGSELSNLYFFVDYQPFLGYLMPKHISDCMMSWQLQKKRWIFAESMEITLEVSRNARSDLLSLGWRKLSSDIPGVLQSTSATMSIKLALISVIDKKKKKKNLSWNFLD